MSRHSKNSARIDSGLVEVKSKFDAEFRRFSVPRNCQTFDDFYKTLEDIHQLQSVPCIVTYTDPEGDLLPINNDDNFQKAVSTAKPVIRLCIQRKGMVGSSTWELNGYGTAQRKKNPIISRLIASEPKPTPRVQIGVPEDFRRVSAIIDVDIVPETHRRVKLIKSGQDKPLGFYIRDGTSVRVTPHGLEKVPGVFISRLIPGGLAEMTGLLAVNDEVLEVNGIEVAGKTLDQVTDMMVANSSNLIITVKPVNQRNNISPRRGGSGRLSQKSTGSYTSAQSQPSTQSYDSDEITEETDEVRDYSKDSSKHSSSTKSSSSKDLRGSKSSKEEGSMGRGSKERESVEDRQSVGRQSMDRQSTGSGRQSKEREREKSKEPSPALPGSGSEGEELGQAQGTVKDSTPVLAL